ncbi:MAG: hypothetical protein OXG91_04075 [bacterium]|nr:hypothetical protein [bacterium]
MTIDVDSMVCGVSCTDKAGTAYGHTKQLGYHPLVATRAETAAPLPRNDHRPPKTTHPTIPTDPKR